MLSRYKQKLESSFIIKDMKTYQNALSMMQIDRLYEIYPELICSIFEKMYRVEGIPRNKMLKLMRKESAGKVKITDLISDGNKIRKALL
jgi:electron transfer flavoprotein-quinone oxidoreductase